MKNLSTVKTVKTISTRDARWSSPTVLSYTKAGHSPLFLAEATQRPENRASAPLFKWNAVVFVRIPQILGAAPFEGAVASGDWGCSPLRHRSLTEFHRDWRGEASRSGPDNQNDTIYHAMYRYCCPMLRSSERVPKRLPSTLCDNSVRDTAVVWVQPIGDDYRASRVRWFSRLKWFSWLHPPALRATSLQGRQLIKKRPH